MSTRGASRGSLERSLRTPRLLGRSKMGMTVKPLRPRISRKYSFLYLRHFSLAQTNRWGCVGRG
ncbi:hypothetical protein E2C01_025207 [Portunus trituberculatus]|uniref:Uncharacterized protein n=1 Tax=Portunus trituberculatus TaxID=210409 RepID=A0A5B7EEZ0_PORTR|nr:hypothetical protein [Portunus trituberculatus]